MATSLLQCLNDGRYHPRHSFFLFIKSLQNFSNVSYPVFNKTPQKLPISWVWVMFPKYWKKSWLLQITCIVLVWCSDIYDAIFLLYDPHVVCLYIWVYERVVLFCSVQLQQGYNRCGIFIWDNFERIKYIFNKGS